MPYIDPAGIFPFVLLSIVVLFYAGLLKLCIGDARKRGKSPILVCILVLGFFPIGLVLWLLFRPAVIEDDPQPPFQLEDYRVQ